MNGLSWKEVAHETDQERRNMVQFPSGELLVYTHGRHLVVLSRNEALRCTLIGRVCTLSGSGTGYCCLLRVWFDTVGHSGYINISERHILMRTLKLRVLDVSEHVYKAVYVVTPFGDKHYSASWIYWSLSPGSRVGSELRFRETTVFVIYRPSFFWRYWPSFYLTWLMAHREKAYGYSAPKHTKSKAINPPARKSRLTKIDCLMVPLRELFSVIELTEGCKCSLLQLSKARQM